eukprot:TRINITY_DN1379_c0_g1_i1.p1 TRINITY_DN1379_c0_g1~~TRINITY_DN1379_c0_g1_i1.p1  ORF type:complete len:361 (+),score=100.71 TRINITY_DN1379_c0_g1_i1:66-1148(+)
MIAKQILLATLLLFFGMWSSISTKSMFQQKSKNLLGHRTLFNKPWYSTLVMFIGMSFLIFIWKKEKKERDEKKKSLLNQGKKVQPEVKPFKLLIPTVFDLVASSINNYAFIFISAALVQMFGGSINLFTILFSVTILKRKQKSYHYIGVIIAAFGILVVGLSAILDATSPTSMTNTMIGSLLAILSQCVWALQFIVEDHFMNDADSTPSEVVAFEGIFGSLLMIFIVLPLCMIIKGGDPGDVVENSIDTVTMLKGNGMIIMWSLVFCFVIPFYNIFGQSITAAFSAVHRTFIESMRGLVVWIASLIMHYFISEDLGEPWTKHSYIRGIGYIFIVFGTLIYNGAIKLAGIYYEEKKEEKEE